MKKNLLLILMTVCSAFAFADITVFTAVKGGKHTTHTIKLEEHQGAMRAKIPASSVPKNAHSITLTPDFMRAKVGEKGFFILPNGMYGDFKKRDITDKKFRKIHTRQTMTALSGFGKGDVAYMAIAKGMRFECRTEVNYEKNKYQMRFYFDLNNLPVYEDLIIDFYTLKGDDANYSAMGRLYRKLKLESGEVKPITKRATPELMYASQAPEIRIRQAWKPYPSPVPEQTEATEPPLKVKVTFDRVSQIIDELKRQGVEKAQICLVGWNKSGHDGRWPQTFPVEEKLGGQEKLEKLVKKAQSMGYQIVCHSNAVGACSIADCFDINMMSHDRYGKVRKSNVWSGGQFYRLCPKKYHETLSKDNINRISKLGFKGLHYIDVISTINPVGCHNPLHPTTSKESGEYWAKELDDAKKLFGGIASEGGYDYIAGHLDYGLYITFFLKKIPPMADRYAPIWHIIYNGIIMSNAATDTVNYSIKPREDAMKVVEFATRPSFYFYSAFATNADDNWMGKVDLSCDTDEAMVKSVSAIKKGYDLLQEIGHLQYAFFEEHKEVEPNVFLSRFSDGTEIICNYTDSDKKYKGEKIAPKSYKVFAKK